MGTSYSEQVQRACHRPSHLARSPRGPEKPFRRPVNASLVSLGLPRPLLSFHLEDAQITLLQIHESCSCPGVVLRPPVRQSPAGGWVTNAGCGAPPQTYRTGTPGVPHDPRFHKQPADPSTLKLQAPGLNWVTRIRDAKGEEGWERSYKVNKSNGSECDMLW